MEHLRHCSELVLFWAPLLVQRGSMHPSSYWICLADSHQLGFRSFPQRSRSGSKSREKWELVGYAPGGRSHTFSPESSSHQVFRASRHVGEPLGGWRTAGQVSSSLSPGQGRALHGAEAGGRLGTNVTDHDHFYEVSVMLRGFVPADDEFRCRQALQCSVVLLRSPTQI